MSAQVVAFPGARPPTREPEPGPVTVGQVLAALNAVGALTAAEVAQACGCRQRDAEQRLGVLVRMGWPTPSRTSSA